MNPSSAYMEIIAKRAGPWSMPVRWSLSAAAFFYMLAAQRRNWQFDNGTRKITRLPVPVISVGNLTVGGTGKTPLVIDLAQRLSRRRFRPAVVARGYKSAAGHLGDELLVVRSRLPDVICIGNPDRAVGGRAAIEQGADVIVLDDGFQHRRLARDLDIVIIDATNPFGFDHLLPRGLLREPASELRRADLIVISRCNLVSEAQLHLIAMKLATHAPGVKRIACRTVPAGVSDLDGNRPDDPIQRAVLFAGIGNPASFVATVRELGIDPVGALWWPDHHRYQPADVLRLQRSIDAIDCDAALTTCKDAVKLNGPWRDFSPPIRVVDINVAFTGDGEQVVEHFLEKSLSCASTF